SIGHHKEWIEACKTGGPTTCNFDYSGALAETAMLGAAAYRTGKPLVWDAKHLKADIAEADRFIRKEDRKGWSLEGCSSQPSSRVAKDRFISRPALGCAPPTVRPKRRIREPGHQRTAPAV